MTLILDPPPSTLPIDSFSMRPFNCELGSLQHCQSRSLPRFVLILPGSITASTSSVPPASSNSTLASVCSARRPATTEPDAPAPQTTKSYSSGGTIVCSFRLVNDGDV